MMVTEGEGANALNAVQIFLWIETKND